MSGRGVTPADDRLHPPAEPHPLWTETAWFAFMVPERALAGTIYLVFRPNLGVASLGVYVWDAAACEPWRVPYGLGLWHLPLPAGDLDDLSLAGLRLRCLEPLTRYALAYEDGQRIALELEYAALLPPRGVGIGGGRGHLDQPCRVRGRLRLRGEEIAVDCLDLRDRSWSVRDDRRSVRASYAYAVASERDGFLAAGFEHEGASRLVAGFLLRDGVAAALEAGTREVVARERGHPVQIRLRARDALGRSLEAEGSCVSRLAYPATPGLFAWMSLTEWWFDGRRAFGSDQDVWSLDLLPGPDL